MVTKPDVRVRAFISHIRPPESADIANWIDPKGHCEGTMVFRWSRASDPIPNIDTELVSWSEL